MASPSPLANHNTHPKIKHKRVHQQHSTTSKQPKKKHKHENKQNKQKRKTQFLFFGDIKRAPSDEILGVKVMFLEDKCDTKIDLSIGAYRDNDGMPVVLKTVGKVSLKNVLWEERFSERLTVLLYCYYCIIYYSSLLSIRLLLSVLLSCGVWERGYHMWSHVKTAVAHTFVEDHVISEETCQQCSSSMGCLWRY